MKLKQYIEELQKLYDEHGDLVLYSAIDDEGNGYNQVYYGPGVRLLPSHEEEYRPENLVPMPEEGESLEEWSYDHCMEDYYDEDTKELDLSECKKVVLIN